MNYLKLNKCLNTKQKRNDQLHTAHMSTNQKHANTNLNLRLIHLKKTGSVPKSYVCNSFCFTSSEIYQPTDVNVLKKTERIYSMRQKKTPVAV